MIMLRPGAGDRHECVRGPPLYALFLFNLADMVLSVELETELGDQIELGLQEIDVLLLIMHQLLEQIARYIILDRMAMRRGLFVEGPRIHLGLQVAVDDLLYGLPDPQRLQRLHVGKAIEEDDALDELVGVLHLLNRLLTPFLGEHLVAPIVEKAKMQPVLVHRGELMAQCLVEILDNLRIASHKLFLLCRRVADRMMQGPSPRYRAWGDESAGQKRFCGA